MADGDCLSRICHSHGPSLLNWGFEIPQKTGLETQTPTDKYKLQSVAGIVLLYLSSLEKKSTVRYSIILSKSLIDFMFQKLPSSLLGCNSSRNTFDVSPKGTFITCSFSWNIIEHKVKYPIANRLIG